jgi:trans-aconitate methyltransferase
MMNELGDVRRIIDLGCGFGFSTIALKQLWPNAAVIGTNIRDTIQFQVASKLGRKYGFEMIDENATIPQPVDLVFASEYFEHILDPIQHLRQIIRQAQPRNWLIANTFGPEAIGHFDEYLVDGQMLKARQTSKVFKQTLVNAGYDLVKTRFWNSRPQFYRRAQTS